MRKVIGVGAVLLLAGAVMAPANAAQSADLAPVAVVQTVAVEADPVAVLDFESPAVATVAAPEPEPVAVVPVAVEPAPVAPVEPVRTPEPVVVPVTVETVGGTVTETETPATPEVVPEVIPEPTPPAEPTPEPEVVPEPETPEVVQVQEGDAYAYSEWDPAFYEYNIDPATGQPFAGEYVGTVYAKSLDYFAGRTDVVVKEQPGVTFHPDMNPMGTNVLYVYHLFTAVAPAE